MISCDHYINIELATLAEWIKIVFTVSVFSGYNNNNNDRLTAFDPGQPG